MTKRWHTKAKISLNEKLLLEEDTRENHGGSEVCKLHLHLCDFLRTIHRRITLIKVKQKIDVALVDPEIRV